ncbi:MAG: CGGC domain-containing protein [Desulfobulbaceae bacterium]|jgi:predicted metal-binding protein|nr:CGGC domain-containing protein [Desulfobulbaceae bacterium]
MDREKVKPIKIGIVTCTNATQDLDCCSVSCLRDFDKRLGSFHDYPQNATLRLMGIISCAGCPTRAYPEKILRRVDTLVQFGVNSIHFANCMVALCPFIKKYAEAIKKKYPEMNLMEGSHEAHISNEKFRENVACAFETGKDMADIILDRL